MVIVGGANASGRGAGGSVHHCLTHHLTCKGMGNIFWGTVNSQACPMEELCKLENVLLHSMTGCDVGVRSSNAPPPWTSECCSGGGRGQVSRLVLRGQRLRCGQRGPPGAPLSASGWRWAVGRQGSPAGWGLGLTSVLSPSHGTGPSTKKTNLNLSSSRHIEQKPTGKQAKKIQFFRHRPGNLGF